MTRAALAALLVLATPATAQEWVIGLSGWNLRSGATGGMVAEVLGRPQWDYGWVQLGLGGAVAVDSDSNAWIGAGVTALAPLSGPWFVEASLMPGYYHADSPAADLGSDFQIRSLIGLGYRLPSGNAVSVAIDHRSNASLGDMNPGVNGANLRYRASF